MSTVPTRQQGPQQQPAQDALSCMPTAVQIANAIISLEFSDWFLAVCQASTIFYEVAKIEDAKETPRPIFSGGLS